MARGSEDTERKAEIETATGMKGAIMTGTAMAADTKGAIETETTMALTTREDIIGETETKSILKI